MKPIKFKGSNTEFAKNQKEYETLPALRFKAKGEVITCWQLTWRERFQVLFSGKIWHSQLTFKSRLQPVFITVKRKELFLLKSELKKKK